jgi:hypothetical protein
VRSSGTTTNSIRIRARAGVARALPLVLVGLAAIGCNGVRRAALKTVDPTLAKSPRWERQRAGLGEYELGPFTIERARVREQAIGQDLGTPEAAPRKPGWRYDLTLTVRGPARSYTATCTAHRLPTMGADYGEVADVANDEVRIECELQGDARWHLLAQGRLDKNLGGELEPEGATAIAPLTLEVLLWVARLKLIRRHLPDPVLQLRRDRTAIAAMIAARPEWAWVAPTEQPELQGIAITAMAALHALPLGFDE